MKSLVNHKTYVGSVVLGGCFISLHTLASAQSDLQQVPNNASPMRQADFQFDPFAEKPAANVPGEISTTVEPSNDVQQDNETALLQRFYLPPLQRLYFPQRSYPGSLISSTPVDPLMTSRQEQRLLDVLQTFDDADWTGDSIVDLVSRLKKQCPVWLDRDELELLGVDPESHLPFAGEIPPGVLGARIGAALRPLEICLQIRSARLEITSRDGADARPAIRIYDVKPLVLATGGDVHSLIHVIRQTVEPDSWLVAGGTASVLPLAASGRYECLLVLSAPTQTQLQVQALLDQLNSMPQPLTRENQSTGAFQVVAPNPRLNINRDVPRFDDRVRLGSGF